MQGCLANLQGTHLFLAIAVPSGSSSSLLQESHQVDTGRCLAEILAAVLSFSAVESKAGQVFWNTPPPSSSQTQGLPFLSLCCAIVRTDH